MPSLKHHLLARLIPRLRPSTDVVDVEDVRREKLAAQRSAKSEPPARVVRRFDLTRIEGLGFAVHALSPCGKEPRRTIVYLHGGGFTAAADSAHWNYAAKLARLLDARVVLPLYPLAPEHTWRDAVDPLVGLIEQLAIDSPHGLVLAGDSAGGGLALSVAQAVARRPGPQPTHLLLIAPWVDLTSQATGTAEASARDPWLNFSRLTLFASWWAGEDDLAHPSVSPGLAEASTLAALPPTLMFCGTNDTLQPACAALAARADDAGWDLTYVEEPGLIHVYPILPIPEAKRALARTIEFLRLRTS